MTNDKTLEADADFCDSADKHRLTNGLTEKLQAENTELKKHIKVLANCLESYRHASSVKHPSIHANADKALASLPEELRGL